MLFSKNVLAAVALLFSVSLQAHAHAAISPMLGLKGTPARGNVQRPSAAKPCGNIAEAGAIDASNAIIAAADGTFTATIKNFNAGADGSLAIASAKVDTTGTGKFTSTAQVVKNGEKAPRQVKSVPLTLKLPAGATCTGGKTKDKCVVSLTTTAGFGNCVVVQKKAANAAVAKPKAKTFVKVNKPTAPELVAEDNAAVNNAIVGGNAFEVAAAPAETPAARNVRRSREPSFAMRR